MNHYQRLRDIREDRDLTQKQIAEVLKIGQSGYSKYERGTNIMGIDKYITLELFYNVSLDHLCGLINEPRAIYKKRLYTRLRYQNKVGGKGENCLHQAVIPPYRSFVYKI